MEFAVVRMRCKGRPLPRRDVVNREAEIGDLRVEQLYDETLNRHLRIARLVDPLRPVHVERLPTLHDPVLVAMSPEAFTLAGFERVDGVEYAQSWLVRRPASAAPRRWR